MTPYQALRATILLASAGFILGLLWLSCGKAAAATGEIQFTMPAKGNDSTCVASITYPAGKQLIYVVTRQGVGDTLRTGLAAIGSVVVVPYLSLPDGAWTLQVQTYSTQGAPSCSAPMTAQVVVDRTKPFPVSALAVR